MFDNIINVNIVKTNPVSNPNDFFNSLCFIYNTTLTDEVIKIKTKDEFTDSGLQNNPVCLNVFLSVFEQSKDTPIYFFPKSPTQSIEDWYKENTESIPSYFVVWEEKDANKVSILSKLIGKDGHLVFLSTLIDVTNTVSDLKLAWMVLDGYEKYLLTDSKKRINTDSGLALLRELRDGYELEYPLYPEVVWIARCTQGRPSSVQWLYKKLENVVLSESRPPVLATTYSKYLESEVTLGSGTTCQSVPIEQQVCLDWVRTSIQMRLWNVLKNSPKINATKDGLGILEQELFTVLTYAVDENIFTSFKITDRQLNKQTSTASFKFQATLFHSILGVDTVEGFITL